MYALFVLNSLNKLTFSDGFNFFHHYQAKRLFLTVMLNDITIRTLLNNNNYWALYFNQNLWILTIINLWQPGIKRSCFGPTTPWSKSNSLCLRCEIYARGSRLMFYSFSITFIRTIYFDIYLNFITSGSSAPSIGSLFNPVLSFLLITLGCYIIVP